MSRKAKIWLIVLAAPIALAAAAVIALKLIFTDDRLKSMIIPQVEKATGRTVAIADMSLSLLPAIALEMDGITISNREGEGFARSPFLSLQSLRLNVKLLPLLGSRVEVTSLEMDRPHLLLEVNARNETNYADLAGGTGPAGDGLAPADSSGTQEPAGRTETPAATAVLVSALRVDGGVIEYLNHKDNSATRLRGIRMSSEVDARGERILVTGSAECESLSYGTIAEPLVDGLRLGLNHQISYDPASDVLTFVRGDLTVQDMRLTLAGTMADLRKENSVLDLSIGSDSVNIADLLSLVPKEYMKKAEGLKGTGTAQVHIALTGVITDSTTGDLAGRITARGATIHYPQLPKPITNISIVCAFFRTAIRQEFRVEKLTANLGNDPVSMTMTVVNFDAPALTVSASGALDLARVREYYPLEAGTELSGRMKADVNLAGRVDDPMTMKASGTMEFSNVTARSATSKNPVRNLNGTVTFNNRTIESKSVSLALGSSDLTLGFRLTNYLSLLSDEKAAARPAATVTLRSHHLYTKDILGGEDHPNTPGAAPADGRRPATPAESPEPRQTQAAASPQPGRENPFPLPGVEMDVSAVIGTLTTEKFEFTDVRGTMKVSNGVITMKNLALKAFGGSVVSQGTLDLRSPSRPQFNLRLDLNALQANSLLPHFTSFGKRLNGALTMNTTMKGELNDTLGLVPSSLDGTGKVFIQNGVLTGFKVNQALASSLKLPDLETVAFKDWTNGFSIQQGRIVIKDLKISAFNAEYVVGGSHGLLDGTLDYRMTVFLPQSLSQKIAIAGFAGEAVNLFKDEGGRLKLDFNVGGTTEDPKLQLDTEPAKRKAEELAKQKLEDEKQKLQKSLQEKAGDALKKLFKKPK